MPTAVTETLLSTWWIMPSESCSVPTQHRNVKPGNVCLWSLPLQSSHVYSYSSTWGRETTPKAAAHGGKAWRSMASLLTWPLTPAVTPPECSLDFRNARFCKSCRRRAGLAGRSNLVAASPPFASSSRLGFVAFWSGCPFDIISSSNNNNNKNNIYQ